VGLFATLLALMVLRSLYAPIDPNFTQPVIGVCASRTGAFFVPLKSTMIVMHAD
jgi:hypothetical protein